MGKRDSAENLMIRIEAMMERGQAFSEPAVLSGTDRTLDDLLAGAKRPPAARVTQARSPFRSPRTSASGGRRTNWLDLPSLQELIDLRRALLEGNAAWPMSELDASSNHE